jgi:hypothetical protein
MSNLRGEFRVEMLKADLCDLCDLCEREGRLTERGRLGEEDEEEGWGEGGVTAGMYEEGPATSTQQQ